MQNNNTISKSQYNIKISTFQNTVIMHKLNIFILNQQANRITILVLSFSGFILTRSLVLSWLALSLSFSAVEKRALVAASSFDASKSKQGRSIITLLVRVRPLKTIGVLNDIMSYLMI